MLQSKIKARKKTKASNLCFGLCQTKPPRQTTPQLFPRPFHALSKFNLTALANIQPKPHLLLIRHLRSRSSTRRRRRRRRRRLGIRLLLRRCTIGRRTNRHCRPGRSSDVKVCAVEHVGSLSEREEHVGVSAKGDASDGTEEVEVDKVE